MKITWVALVCVVIFTSYAITYYIPDYLGVEGWYSLMTNLSIGYFTAFLFYVFQIYLPAESKRKKAEQVLRIDIEKCIEEVEKCLNYLDMGFNFEGDRVITKFNPEAKFIYYRIKRTEGAPIIEYVDLREFLQSLKEILSRKLSILRQNPDYNALDEEWINALVSLECALTDQLFTLGLYYGLSKSIQGIAKTQENLRYAFCQISKLVGYKNKIASMELLTESEIKEYLQFIEKYREQTNAFNEVIKRNKR